MAATDQRIYVAQSQFTDPGEPAARLDAVPGDLQSLRRAACRLVFHYRADGDWTENNIAAERIAEIDTRYAGRMFERLFQLHDVPLTEERLPHQRLIGCCRDFTVLFLSMARHKGTPARARVGFATYFAPGWYVDHEIAEVWDAGEGRWRLIEPEIADGHVDPTDGAILDPLDMDRNRFIVAPQAWLACRAGEADAERFVVAPDLDIPSTRGWPFLVHNLLHDLAALNKQEMVLWDYWGLAENERLDDDQLQLLDSVARAMTADTVSVDELRALYDHEDFRVPPVVTSYSAAADGPLRVSLHPSDR